MNATPARMKVEARTLTEGQFESLATVHLLTVSWRMMRGTEPGCRRAWACQS